MLNLDRIYLIFFENIVENLTEDDTISIIYKMGNGKNILFFWKDTPLIPGLAHRVEVCIHRTKALVVVVLVVVNAFSLPRMAGI